MLPNKTYSRTFISKAILGFGLCTFSAAMIYKYFKKRDDREEVHQQTDESAEAEKLDPKAQKGNKSEKLAVGRQGANSKSEGSKKLTEAALGDEDGTSTICVISSNADNVKEVRSLLFKEKEGVQTSNNSHWDTHENLMTTKDDENLMEVYVTAAASPAKFWVQRISESRKLDNIMDNMTTYYSVANNRAKHQIDTPYLGQIVATFSIHDKKWNRAEIVRILPNHYNPKEITYDVFFLDCGDNDYVLAHEIFELRGDFLSLKFQAIECFLANVKSTLPNDPDIWEEQSITAFKDYTQVTQRKKLRARVVAYKDHVKSGSRYSSKTRRRSRIPGVEIYDIEDDVEVNLGHMMIYHGYAYHSNDN